MFGEDIFSSFFNTPIFQPISAASTQRPNGVSVRDIPVCRERCSERSRDLFTEISRTVDRVFAETARSFFRDADMFPRHFYPGYLREISQIPPTSRRTTGVTLGGDVVERPAANSRLGRHTTDEVVQMDRTRLQWYDSNTRRSLLPPPPPSNRPEPSGRLTAAELSKLPISTFNIKPLGSQQTNPSSPGQAEQSPASSTPVRVLNRNESNADCSPGSAYLQPISRVQTLVQIQPIQSSPSRGFPECEVCLTEYRDKDRLRHLPCGHAFHSKCIDVWLNQSSTCPKCRAGVRTGLKRLERNRQRERNATRPVANAPVRAIRQRSTGPAANQRSAGSTQASTSQTPRQRASRNQSTVRTTNNQRSSSLSSPQNTSSDNSFRQTDSSDLRDATSGEHATPGSGDFQADRSQSGSLSGDPASRNRDEAPRSANAPSGNEPLPRTATTATISRSQNTAGTIRRLGGQSQFVGTMDKSAYARQKAGEAAIRRAELARREQERQRAQQQQQQ